MDREIMVGAYLWRLDLDGAVGSAGRPYVHHVDPSRSTSLPVVHVALQKYRPIFCFHTSFMINSQTYRSRGWAA